MMLMSSKVKIGSASRSSTDLSYFNREVKLYPAGSALGGGWGLLWPYRSTVVGWCLHAVARLPRLPGCPLRELELGNTTGCRGNTQ